MFLIAGILLLTLFLYTWVMSFLIRGLSVLEKEADPTPCDWENSSPPLVSVLIAIHNEEKNLPQLFRGLVNQDYPRHHMEWILIDDRSSDTTPQLLQEFQTEFSQCVRIVRIEPSTNVRGSRKKYALSQGLSVAQGTIILSTDADCLLHSEWVTRMVGAFDSSTGMVLGLSRYAPNQQLSSYFYGIQALDFFGQGMVSASLLAIGFPINANANNMAYSRKAYEEIGGMTSHQHIISGDDDFLLQKIHATKKWKIKYLKHPHSQVQTYPCYSWKELWEQRKRWASKTGMYSSDRVQFLSVIYWCYCVVLATLLGCLFFKSLWPWALFAWGYKSLLDFWVMFKGSRLFQYRPPFRWFIHASLVHLPLIVFAVIFGSFGTFSWKGLKTQKSQPTK